MKLRVVWMNSFVFNWNALLHFQAKRRKRQHHSCYNPPALSLSSAATWVKQLAGIKRPSRQIPQPPSEMLRVGPREVFSQDEGATSSTLRDEVSCLQRDQSYVVGGVYILRGSMELRESLGTPSLLRHPPSLPPPPTPTPPSPLLLSSRFCLTHIHTYTRTYTERITHVRSRASVHSFSRGRSAKLFPQQHIDAHPRLLLMRFDQWCKFRSIRGDNNLSYANDYNAHYILKNKTKEKFQRNKIYVYI